jgi:hypothetical protein
VHVHWCLCLAGGSTINWSITTYILVGTMIWSVHIVEQTIVCDAWWFVEVRHGCISIQVIIEAFIGSSKLHMLTWALHYCKLPVTINYYNFLLWFRIFMSMSNLILINIHVMDMKRHMLICVFKRFMLVDREKKVS